MIWIIFVTLLLFWLIGFVAGVGGDIHILLFFAALVLVIKGLKKRHVV